MERCQRAHHLQPLEGIVDGSWLVKIEEKLPFQSLILDSSTYIKSWIKFSPNKNIRYTIYKKNINKFNSEFQFQNKLYNITQFE